MSTQKNKTIQYDYFVHPVSEDATSAYKAIIPAFGNAIVYGETMQELEEGIRLAIESEIADLKKAKKPVPMPEKRSNFTGKILVRISPILHEKIALDARANGKSLNKYIEEQIR